MPSTPEPHQLIWKAANEAVQSGQPCGDPIESVEAGEAPGALAILKAFPDKAQRSKRLGRAYRKALDRQKYFTEVAADVNALVWSSARAGGTDESVLLALVKEARDSGEPIMSGIGSHVLTVRSSHRRLMTDAAIGSKSTLPAALKRLEAAGLVHIEVPIDSLGLGECSTFTVTVPRAASPGNALSLSTAIPLKGQPQQGGSNATLTDVGSLDVQLHIVWSKFGLGPSARRVWLLLSKSGPMKVTAISEALSLSQNTVRTSLASLDVAGLTEPSEGVWRASEGNLETLDGIADSLGIRSWRERQEERFETERASFEVWRDVQWAERPAWTEAMRRARRLCPLMGAPWPAVEQPVGMRFSWALAA